MIASHALKYKRGKKCMHTLRKSMYKLNIKTIELSIYSFKAYLVAVYPTKTT